MSQLLYKDILPSAQVINTYTDNHIILKTSIHDLLNAGHTSKIQNWKYNRPPDVARCREIAEQIYNKRQWVDWLLYMVYDGQTQTLLLIDGMHRFHALQMIQKENKKPEDLLTPSMFGSNNDATWLYDQSLLISVRTNLSDGQTIDLFQGLNKSIPVPDLYMVDPDLRKRQLIEKVIDEWMTSFPSHFTASKKPNVPNMNRDRWVDILDYVYTKYALNNCNAHILNEKLYELNMRLKMRPPRKVTANALAKCIQSGCFIFLIKCDVLQYEI